jgi:maltooligosyltrehalose trehalohydrolase
MTTLREQRTTLPDGLGAIPLGDGRCLFRIWAPKVEKLEVHILHPFDRFFTAQRSASAPSVAAHAASGGAAASAAGAEEVQATPEVSHPQKRVIPSVSEGSGGPAGAKNETNDEASPAPTLSGATHGSSGAVAASATRAGEVQDTPKVNNPQKPVIPSVSEGSGGRAGAKNETNDEASPAPPNSGTGYHEVIIDNLPSGARYKLRLDGKEERPDPASRLQPEGVHGPSEIVPREFAWNDSRWRGLPFASYVIYELHVGTFTNEGTFDAIIERLDELKDLGITAIELLPIAQFPGTRNWGYDGVQPYAAQHSYGGPLGLKRLVDACHTRNLAVVLDVVYNHLGPEGNYLGEFGPYFTDRYKTAWGLALNFDGPHSDHVRRYFVENALMWIDEFHIDALRVDAVHAIVDHSAEPFLQDLCSAVRERAERLGRKVFTIAESDLNAPRVLLPSTVGGLGFDSQWNDDFHHSLHVLLTGEKVGYYADYGRVADLATVSTTGYLFTGQYSQFRGRRYGAPPNESAGERFVVSAQNHDQVGNRMHGDRLSSLLSFDQLKVSAGALILFPFIPMLFMGEEYGETAPFQYFTSHSDPELIENVRKGRHEEFEAFTWQGEAPDPHDEQTFHRSKLNWNLWKEDSSAQAVPTASEGNGAAAASAAGAGEQERTGTVNHPQDRVIPSVSEGSGGRAGASPETNDPVQALTPGHHAQLRALHRELLRLRRETRALSTLDLSLVTPHADEQNKTLALHRKTKDGSQHVWIAFNFSDHPRPILPPESETWKILLDSNDKQWGGSGERANALAPTSFRLYLKEPGSR